MVLVVEDDADLRNLYLACLETLGSFHVVTAQNGSEAFAKARSLRPDVIVTDFAMPIMDGGELARRLITDARTRRIPLVLVSGFESAVPEEARRSCAAVLTKPCEPETLTRLVKEVLASRTPM